MERAISTADLKIRLNREHRGCGPPTGTVARSVGGMDSNSGRIRDVAHHG
jgi:hypothetical protein